MTVPDMLPKTILALFIMPCALLGPSLFAQTVRTTIQLEALSVPDAIVASLSNRSFSSSRASSEAITEPSSDAESVRSLPTTRAMKEHLSSRPFSSFAIGVKADTLGAGIEVATPLSRGFNLRTGADFFAYGYPFSVNGVHYNAELDFRSGQAHLDWFPWHNGFHISPGLLYFKNSVSAIATVPPGQPFQLNDQDFTNSVNDPVHGTASVIIPHKVAPMLTLGFGNLLPRSGRHISVPFEIGVAYVGQTHVNVALKGTACTTDGCVDMATDPSTQNDLKQEVSDVNDTLSSYPIYPIVSVGFAYRF